MKVGTLPRYRLRRYSNSFNLFSSCSINLPHCFTEERINVTVTSHTFSSAKPKAKPCLQVQRRAAVLFDVCGLALHHFINNMFAPSFAHPLCFAPLPSAYRDNVVRTVCVDNNAQLRRTDEIHEKKSCKKNRAKFDFDDLIEQ